MDASKALKLQQLQELIDSVPSSGFAEECDDVNRSSQSKKRTSRRRAEEDGVDDAQVLEPEMPPEKAAFRRIVDLCGYHEFCREQMRARLKREGNPDDAIEHAISTAVGIGLIDDVRWGEMRASALMRKGKGIPGIERELRENGIRPESIDGWPEAYEERFGAELDRALRVLEKNPPRSKNPRSSAYAKLVRKGFSSSIASRASGMWFATVDKQ